MKLLGALIGSLYTPTIIAPVSAKGAYTLDPHAEGKSPCWGQGQSRGREKPQALLGQPRLDELAGAPNLAPATPADDVDRLTLVFKATSNFQDNVLT